MERYWNLFVKETEEDCWSLEFGDSELMCVVDELADREEDAKNILPEIQFAILSSVSGENISIDVQKYRGHNK